MTYLLTGFVLGVVFRNNFQWSKVTSKGYKPLRWWWHKVLCEIGWNMRKLIGTERMYRYHLDKLCKTGFNLYGRKFPTL
jgi:hypothetical protein